MLNGFLLPIPNEASRYQTIYISNKFQHFKIFASKLRPIEIPPKQVLEYLAPFGNHLVQLFLEFLIHDCKIQDADFHTRLCLIYIESIKSSILGTNPIPGIEMLRNKFISMLENSSVYSENTVLAQIVNLPLYEELIILYTRVC